MKGKLYLIPNVIAENTAVGSIPEQIREVVKATSCYLVENVRTARRFISSLKTGVVIETLTFEVLDKKTRTHQLKELFEPIEKGLNIGVISESGCPGVADPGALAVAYAHAQGIQVIPLVGPSSILMALMASGFNGQKFSFHGYIPIDKKEAAKTIRQLEVESGQKGQTQIFIETPFRNNQLFEVLVNTCHPETKLCIAKGVNSTQEHIKTRSILAWKKNKPELHKTPTVFLLYVG